MHNKCTQTTFGGYKLTGKFSSLKVSLSSLILCSFSLAHSLTAWGYTHSAFSCAFRFSPVLFSFLNFHAHTHLCEFPFYSHHTIQTSHTHTTCTLSLTHTLSIHTSHSSLTFHILSLLTLHMLFSCSLSSCSLLTPLPFSCLSLLLILQRKEKNIQSLPYQTQKNNHVPQKKKISRIVIVPHFQDL